MCLRVPKDVILSLEVTLTTGRLFFINNKVDLTDLSVLQEFSEGWTGQESLNVDRLLETLDLAIKAADRGRARSLESEQSAEDMRKYR